LVVSEISLACVLLVAAGLFIRSFTKLLEVDLGFRPENTTAWRVESKRNFPNRVAEAAYYDQLVASVRSIPGVQSAGCSDCLPLGRHRGWGIGGEGVNYPPGEYPTAIPRIIDDGYLEAMKIRLKEGRDFSDVETAETE